MNLILHILILNLFTLIQFSARLKPTFVAFLPVAQHVLSSLRYGIPGKTAIHFAMLGSLISMDSKPYLKLAKGYLTCLHWLQSSTRSVHNSRKNQLLVYTCKTYETRLPILHTILKNQLYTYLGCENRPLRFEYCDFYAT